MMEAAQEMRQIENPPKVGSEYGNCISKISDTFIDQLPTEEQREREHSRGQS